MSESIITRFFVNDHKVLDKFAEKFFESKRQNKDFTDKYNDLKNSLKRHMSQEIILYSSYDGKEKEFLHKINQILNQHMIILRLLDEIYEEKEFFEKMDILTKLMKEHVILEEKYVYVKFDEVLNENKREEVIKELKLHEKESKEDLPY